MEISRLYINIYVTMNARVVWLFSFVHFHEPGAPPPKRAPWYLQCAAWLETSSRRASLDFVVQKYWTNRPGGVRKKTSGYNLVFQMSNKEMKNWQYTTPQQLVQVMYILQVQISPGNFQTSHNFFRHFSFQGSVSWDHRTLPRATWPSLKRFDWVGFPAAMNPYGNIPFPASGEWYDEVLLWFCSDMSHVWVLESLSRWGKNTLFSCKHWSYESYHSRVGNLGCGRVSCYSGRLLHFLLPEMISAQYQTTNAWYCRKQCKQNAQRTLCQ